MIKQALLLFFLFLTSQAFPLLEEIAGNGALGVVDGMEGLYKGFTNSAITNNVVLILDTLIESVPVDSRSAEALLQLKGDFLAAAAQMNEEKVLLSDTAKTIIKLLSQPVGGLGLASLPFLGDGAMSLPMLNLLPGVVTEGLLSRPLTLLDLAARLPVVNQIVGSIAEDYEVPERRLMNDQHNLSSLRGSRKKQ